MEYLLVGLVVGLGIILSPLLMVAGFYLIVVAVWAICEIVRLFKRLGNAIKNGWEKFKESRKTVPAPRVIPGHGSPSKEFKNAYDSFIVEDSMRYIKQALCEFDLLNPGYKAIVIEDPPILGGGCVLAGSQKWETG